MIASIQRPLSLPAYLTIDQVAQLAGVGRPTVAKAVFRTKAGMAERGSTNWLPRVSRCRAGFRAADVLEWLAVRGQTPDGFAGLTPRREPGLVAGRAGR